MTDIVLDPQCTGWEDNPYLTPGQTGLINVKPRRGAPVPQPFSAPTTVNNYSTTLAGSGTASFQAGGIVENIDRTNTGINCTTTTSINDCSMLLIPFYGPLFGMRWRATSTADFHVTVDEGDPMLVKGNVQYLVAEGLTITNLPMWQITHTQLSSGPHVARVHIPSAQSGTSTVLYHGFIVDSLFQNQVWTPTVLPTSSGTLTNAAVTIPLGGATGYSSVRYCNNDTGAHTVLIKQGSTIIARIPLGAAGSGTETGSWVPNPGFLTSTTSTASNTTHETDANSVVAYSVYGGK